MQRRQWPAVVDIRKVLELSRYDGGAVAKIPHTASLKVKYPNPPLFCKPALPPHLPRYRGRLCRRGPREAGLTSRRGSGNWPAFQFMAESSAPTWRRFLANKKETNP